MSDPSPTHRLFTYGSLLEGERDHTLLQGARPLGPARTRASYYLVDLGVYAALVPGGTTAVSGELYELDRKALAAIDRAKEHPVLFRRGSVELEDGSSAEAYLMTEDKVRGRRRLRGGDWRTRFSRPRPTAGPFVQWARGRHGGNRK